MVPHVCRGFTSFSEIISPLSAFTSMWNRGCLRAPTRKTSLPFKKPAGRVAHGNKDDPRESVAFRPDPHLHFRVIQKYSDEPFQGVSREGGQEIIDEQHRDVGDQDEEPRGRQQDFI